MTGASLCLLLLYLWSFPQKKKEDQLPSTSSSLVSFFAPENKDRENSTQSINRSDTNNYVPPETLEEWNREINQFSQKLSALTNDFEASEHELDQFAKQFPERFLPNLKSLALDSQRSGDERILSIEILSRSQYQESLSVLAEIALSPIPADKNAARANEELAFRAAAIEGLNKKEQLKQSQSQLKQILQKTDNSFLADRAERTLKALEGKAPPLEVQDRKALEKVLRK